MLVLLIFFFNDTATTEIYTLSLHDALPILDGADVVLTVLLDADAVLDVVRQAAPAAGTVWLQTSTVGLEGADRSEEHTSELQSRQYLVCRLLLEKKKR